MRTRRLSALTLIVSLVAGCGGESKPATTTTTPTERGGRPVTDAEALVLARLLQRNYADGGARFQGVVAFPGPTPVAVKGVVDWRRIGGRADFLQSGLPTTDARRIYWSKRVVLAQAGRAGRARHRWVAAAANRNAGPVQFYLDLLALLSARNIDNVAVIQDRGARFLRTATVDAIPVRLFDLGRGSRTTYWVGIRDQRLHRVQTRVDRYGGTATLTFTARGPRRIQLPPRREWTRTR